MLLFDHYKNNQNKCCQLQFFIPAKSQCTYGTRYKAMQRLISVQRAAQWSLLFIINVIVDFRKQETFPIARAVLHITTGKEKPTRNYATCMSIVFSYNFLFRNRKTVPITFSCLLLLDIQETRIRTAFLKAERWTFPCIFRKSFTAWKHRSLCPKMPDAPSKVCNKQEEDDHCNLWTLFYKWIWILGENLGHKQC